MHLLQAEIAFSILAALGYPFMLACMAFLWTRRNLQPVRARNLFTLYLSSIVALLWFTSIVMRVINGRYYPCVAMLEVEQTMFFATGVSYFLRLIIVYFKYRTSKERFDARRSASVIYGTGAAGSASKVDLSSCSPARSPLESQRGSTLVDPISLASPSLQTNIEQQLNALDLILPGVELHSFTVKSDKDVPSASTEIFSTDNPTELEKPRHHFEDFKSKNRQSLEDCDSRKRQSFKAIIESTHSSEIDVEIGQYALEAVSYKANLHEVFPVNHGDQRGSVASNVQNRHDNQDHNHNPNASHQHEKVTDEDKSINKLDSKKNTSTFSSMNDIYSASSNEHLRSKHGSASDIYTGDTSEAYNVSTLDSSRNKDHSVTLVENNANKSSSIAKGAGSSSSAAFVFPFHENGTHFDAPNPPLSDTRGDKFCPSRHDLSINPIPNLYQDLVRMSGVKSDEERWYLQHQYLSNSWVLFWIFIGSILLLNIPSTYVLFESRNLYSIPADDDSCSSRPRNIVMIVFCSSAVIGYFWISIRLMRFVEENLFIKLELHLLAGSGAVLLSGWAIVNFLFVYFNNDVFPLSTLLMLLFNLSSVVCSNLIPAWMARPPQWHLFSFGKSSSHSGSSARLRNMTSFWSYGNIQVSCCSDENTSRRTSVRTSVPTSITSSVYRSSSINFDRVLHHPEACALLEEFLVLEFSVENLYFYREVSEFKDWLHQLKTTQQYQCDLRTPLVSHTEREILNRSYAIYERYFVPNAPFELNFQDRKAIVALQKFFGDYSSDPNNSDDNRSNRPLLRFNLSNPASPQSNKDSNQFLQIPSALTSVSSAALDSGAQTSLVASEQTLSSITLTIVSNVNDGIHESEVHVSVDSNMMIIDETVFDAAVCHVAFIINQDSFKRFMTSPQGAQAFNILLCSELGR